MPDDAQFDVVVVGAGVVGLAVAEALSQDGRSVLVLERREGPGRETTSRNSEVIHAGIYYPPGSLRAQLCVEGNALLYRFCAEHGVGCRAQGKLIVATADDEVPQLEELHRRGVDNGARGLELLDAAEVARREPAVRAVAGLLSPSTGIVDAHGLVKALEARTRAAGGEVLYRCSLVDVDDEPRPGRCVLVVDNPGGRERVVARALVNAAGLESDRVAAMAGVDGYRLHWCKGDYFSVSGTAARSVSHLIYPVPASRLVGLGVHVTLDLGGRMRLGPDATYVERDAPGLLDVDPSKAGAFHEAAQRYLPALRLEDLQPDMAGIRPKLQGPDDPWCDFVVCQSHPGQVHLIGIDSPGLTAALALAKQVRRIITKCL